MLAKTRMPASLSTRGRTIGCGSSLGRCIIRRPPSSFQWFPGEQGCDEHDSERAHARHACVTIPQCYETRPHAASAPADCPKHKSVGPRLTPEFRKLCEELPATWREPVKRGSAAAGLGVLQPGRDPVQRGSWT